LIVWIDSALSAPQIFGRVVTSAGPIGPVLPISTRKASAVSITTLSGGANEEGEVVFFWSELDGATHTVRATTFSDGAIDYFEETLYSGPDSVGGFSAAVAPDGSAVVLYILENTIPSGDSTIAHYFRPAAGFSGPVDIDGDFSEVAIGLGTASTYFDGQFLAFWFSLTVPSLFVSEFDPAGKSWSVQTAVGGRVNFGSGDTALVLAESAGRLGLFWLVFTGAADEVRAAWLIDGAWTTEEIVYNPGPTFTRLLGAPSGDGSVVLNIRNTSPDDEVIEVYGPGSASGPIDPITVASPSQGQNVAADGRGGVFVASFENDSSVAVNKRLGPGEYGRQFVVEGGVTGPTIPAITGTGDGEIIVVYFPSASEVAMRGFGSPESQF
jgi:hypothetical protein